MKYTRFEDLPVWKAARDAGQRILVMTENAAFTRRRGVADQLERAAISISNNIAEGFESGTTSQLISYLYHARGSAGETRSMLRVLVGVCSFSNLKSEISDLIPLCESISRQIRAWADSLQNSDIAGPRHLNEATRARFERKASAEAFIAELKRWAPPLPNSPPDTGAHA